jgi:hypothetical protein
MKLAEARAIIERGGPRRGYVVSFEWREYMMLRSDHFPDYFHGEPMIEDETEAWRMAEALAKNLGAERICNVTVRTYHLHEGRKPEYVDGSARKRRLLPR